MLDHIKREEPARSQSIDYLMSRAMRTATDDPTIVDTLVSQWQDDHFDIFRMCSNNTEQLHGSNGLIESANNLREYYLSKVATLYRSIDKAIDSMEKAIASVMYAHPYPSDEELEQLPSWELSNAIVELGIDEHGEPLKFDFSSTPHLVGAYERYGSYNLIRTIMEQITDAKFVVMGDAFCSSCDLAIPKATSKQELKECMEWLKAELDQRIRMKTKFDVPGYPLFIIADTYNDDWLLAEDTLSYIAKNCSHLNMHLIVITNTDFMSLQRRSEEATLLTLTNSLEDDFGIALQEGSYQVFYHYMTSNQFNSWLKRLEDPSGSWPILYYAVPVYKDLGVGFITNYSQYKGRRATEPKTYQQVVREDEAYRKEHNNRSRYRRFW